MFFATLLLTVVPPQTPSTAAEHPQRAFHKLDEDLRRLLREEATTRDKSRRAQSLFKMTKLYRELMTDPRMVESDTLKTYRIKLWGRMTRVKKEIQRDVARRKRGGKRSRRAKRATKSPQNEALAKEATEAIADHFSLIGYSMGGAANVLSSDSGRRGGGALGPDWGQDLVELIERTINPDFWEVNGGPGSIFYYKSLHALVIRATSEVHHKIGGAIKGLRKVGM